mmetsp:Transcript_19449/g.35258  ORF Transcript_19449/g.35258 Transcript_19449/m.35258 type:complete len:252 (+) Transcript_19449:73-828(+)
MSSGPIIEELPDDFDVAAHKAEKAAGGGLRTGFFNRNAPKAPEPPVQEAKQGAAEKQSEPAVSVSVPSGSAPWDDLTAGLRSRMRKVAEQQKLQQSSGSLAESLAELSQAVEAMKETRWPTTAARQRWERATSDIDVTLAELRSVSNDARRHRSGEEKKAAAEFRRIAEDSLERLRKVVEQIAPKDDKEDQTAAIVREFHDQPLIAKVRILADARVAIVLVLGSFLTGMALALGILVEVYTAWGCSWRCSQ